MYHYSRHFVPRYSPRSPNVLTFEPLGAPPFTSGRRQQFLGDIYTGRPFTHPQERFHHLPFFPGFLSGSEESPNSFLPRAFPSDESPSPPDLSPSTYSASVSSMEDPPQRTHDASVRDAAPDSSSVGHNDRHLPAYYPFNDPQMSSTSTRSAPSHPGSYFPPSNTTSPPSFRDQSNSAQCAFAPVQISYYPLPYGRAQPQRCDPFPAQRARHNSEPRDSITASTSSHSQYSSRPEQHHDHRLSSDLLESPKWTPACNLGSGRSLSASQLESPDFGRSEHTVGSSSNYARPSYNAQSAYRRYPEDHTDHDDPDDEGSDIMSDGIASDEGVYSWSDSDRDVFDDEDFDSDDEYDSDEYSDN